MVDIIMNEATIKSIPWKAQDQGAYLKCLLYSYSGDEITPDPITSMTLRQKYKQIEYSGQSTLQCSNFLEYFPW